MYCVVVLQIVSVLYPWKAEMEELILKDFIDTDEFDIIWKMGR